MRVYDTMVIVMKYKGSPLTDHHWVIIKESSL